MNEVYNPGCALMLYKPKFAERILEILKNERGDIALHSICCHHEPKLPAGSCIINTCAGCDKRFGSLYEGISTIFTYKQKNLILQGFSRSKYRFASCVLVKSIYRGIFHSQNLVKQDFFYLSKKEGFHPLQVNIFLHYSYL